MISRARLMLGTVCAGVALIAAVATVAPTTTPARAVGATGVVPSNIVDRYLTTRPPLGDVTVVSIVGESQQRKLLAATLQGVVNRSSVRMYLLGARSQQEDQLWLDRYEAQGLIHVVAHVDLDQALATFAHEASGFVVGSFAEPWTINTATTTAAARRALVATPDEVAGLEGLGLTELDDQVGRWADAPSAYEAIAAQTRGQLAYQGVAIVKPDELALRDFLVQQQIMAISTRPSDPDYARIMKLVEAYPPSHPVYGYVSDNDPEELTAIVTLSKQGRFVVPTDTTDNLSFHIAVAAQRPRTVLRGDDRPVAACKSDQVNVVLATSDGDNMVIPEAYLPTGDRYSSPNRGSLPMGWGISPAASVLMPAIWDDFAANTTPQDEIVSLLGIGYAAPSLMPPTDAAAYLGDAARLDATLGVDTTWSLDLVLDKPTAPAWDAVAGSYASAGWSPKGQLLDYDHYGAAPLFFGAGLPVLTSQATTYLATPEDIAAQIAGLQAMSPQERPLVNFIPATVWSTTYDRFVAALGPLADEGVRFLTPRQAWACLAAAGLHAPTTTTTTTTTATSMSTSGSQVPSTSGGPTSTWLPSSDAVPVAAVPDYVG